jgi:hypothetical protein
MTALKSRVCVVSGIVAAVTKVHCFCDVICCLAMDQERLEGSFLLMEVRRLLKFHVLLVKSALECYRS